MERNVLGIVDFVNEYPSQGDLEAFMANFHSEAVAATFTLVPISGSTGYPKHSDLGATF